MFIWNYFPKILFKRKLYLKIFSIWQLKVQKSENMFHYKSEKYCSFVSDFSFVIVFLYYFSFNSTAHCFVSSFWKNSKTPKTHFKIFIFIVSGTAVWRVSFSYYKLENYFYCNAIYSFIKFDICKTHTV